MLKTFKRQRPKLTTRCLAQPMLTLTAVKTRVKRLSDVTKGSIHCIYNPSPNRNGHSLRLIRKYGKENSFISFFLLVDFFLMGNVYTSSVFLNYFLLYLFVLWVIRIFLTWCKKSSSVSFTTELAFVFWFWLTSACVLCNTLYMPLFVVVLGPQ